MVFDPKSLTPSGLLPMMEAAIQAAYDQGRADAVAAILSAAGAPLPEVTAPKQQASTANRRAAPTAKAPRGLVPEVIAVVMDSQPGLTISDYEQLAVELDDRVSAKSVGNELRRGEGIRYERDRPRGYKWYLKGRKMDEAADDPGKEVSAASLFNQAMEEANAPALA